MYNEYFGFKEAPFSIAPDPRYLYMTSQHREALAHLVYGLNSEGGCILLTGEVGTGKTTICRCLLEQIPDQAKVALVLNPKVNETELLETICDELNISYPDSDNSLKTYTDRIYSFLIESNRRNEKIVLIIDEAQNLDSKVLEQLRLLTNLETNQRKLLQIIILGQPELLTILAKTEMRQLAQRITARFHLEPLDKLEVKAYISHRLGVAGQSIQLFPDNSVKLIYKLSKGVPRLINIICDRALLGAYVENQYSVNTHIVKKAATEVFGELKNVEQHQKNKRWLYPLAAITGVVAIVVLIGFFFRTAGNIEQVFQTTSTGTTESTANTTSDKAVLDSKTTDSEHNNQITESAFPDNTGSALASNTVNDLAGELTANQSDNSADGDTSNSAHEPNVASSDGSDGNPESNNTIEAMLPDDSNATLASTKPLNYQGQDSDQGLAYTDLKTIVDNAENSPGSAYQALFKTWDKNYNRNTRITACKQAEKFGLSCLFRRGNINSLKLHNRPAVLTLINDHGERRYITITAISENSATIHSNNEVYKIALQDLNQYWHGQYNLLWNKPEYYSAVIAPGDSGEIIYWLKEQLEKINDTSTPNIVIGKYDNYLIDKVKAFQSQQGLATDGIVGPITIIHLNNQLGIAAPQLIPPPLQTVTNQS